MDDEDALSFDSLEDAVLEAHSWLKRGNPTGVGARLGHAVAALPVVRAELESLRISERAVYQRLLRLALEGLGMDSPEFETARLASERSRLVTTLREICAEFGDNDWPENLDLSDVLEKHLARHLR